MLRPRRFLSCCLALAVASTVGCSKAPTGNAGAKASVEAPHKPSAEGEKLILAAMPAEHQTVIQARDTVKDGDEVAVLGRIGGSTDPWVQGRAAFQIVDPTLKPCNETGDDGCPTPWDYCCSTDSLPKAMATIKFVDAAGKTIETDARQLLGIKELQSIVVKGKAKRDDAGNLTVLATAVYVQRASAGKPHDPAGHTHDHNHDHGDKKEPATQP